MPERDARAVVIELAAVIPFPGFSTARTWAAKASFTSTRPISSKVRPVFSKTFATAPTGPRPIRAGSQPTAVHPTRNAIGSSLNSASLSSATIKQAVAASFCCAALPAVMAPLFRIGRSFASDSAVVSARTPRRAKRGRRRPSSAGPAPERSRTKKGLHPMPSPRAGGFRWRRDPPPPATPHIRARAFGGLDHAGDVAETLHRLRTLAPAIQPVVELCRSRAPSPAHVSRIEFDPAHALYAFRDHDVAGAGLYHHRRRGERLKAAAATAIDLEARHCDRQPRLEGDPAADARGFAVGVGLGEGDVFNPRRIEAGRSSTALVTTLPRVSRSARPDRAAFRGISARRRIFPPSRSRHGRTQTLAASHEASAANILAILASAPIGSPASQRRAASRTINSAARICA